MIYQYFSRDIRETSQYETITLLISDMRELLSFNIGQTNVSSDFVFTTLHYSKHDC